MYFIVSPIAASFFYNSLQVIGESVNFNSGAIQSSENKAETVLSEEDFQDIRSASLQLNALFYNLIKEITAKESQIFYSHFAQISFVCEAYNLDRDFEAEIHSWRILCRRTQRQEDFAPAPWQVLAGIQLIASLVQYFSQEVPSTELLGLYKDVELPSLYQPTDPAEKLPLLRAVVLRTKGHETLPNGKGRCVLVCETEQYGKARIQVTDTNYKPISQFGRFAQPYQTIHVTDLAKQEPEKGEGETDDTPTLVTEFRTTESSHLVLEPDYLVDASAIARCVDRFGRQSSYNYLLSNLRFFAGSEATFMGNLINEMLDQIIDNEHITYEEAYRGALHKSFLEAVFLKDKLMLIYHNLKNQFERLQQFVKKYRSQRLTTEPTFLSATFGLQGRLDVLVEYDEGSLEEDQTNSDRRNLKEIIELKSAKSVPPVRSKAWANDLVQVACYNLLLDDTFESRRGISAILYSQAEDGEYLRNCGKLNFEQQDALLLRNQMVFLDFMIAKENTRIFDQLHKRISQAGLPFYVVDDAKAFDDMWRSSREIDKAYFIAFAGLVVRENIAAKIGQTQNDFQNGFANLWKNSREDKKANFALLEHLTLDFEQSDLATSTLVFHRQTTQSSVTTFRKGDIAVLYPINPNGSLTALKYQLLKCNIVSIGTQQVTIQVWNKHVDAHFLQKHTHWALEPNLLESGNRDLLASLAYYLSIPDAQKDLLLGQRPPEFGPSPNIHIERLNAEQNQILNQALSAKDYFLLQGPPGTGKTSAMLANMVGHIFHQTEENIFLLAFTNRAVDEICKKIEPVCNGQMIRLGSGKEGSPYSLNNLTKDKKIKQVHQILSETRVFVSTVASFYKHLNLFKIKTFDTVIVDEASQLLEPHLCGVLPRFKRFILIGDEKQLPAVVTQDADKCLTKQTDLHEMGIQDLSISMFERLLTNAQQRDWHDCYAMLTTQFRMHGDITQFVNDHFYKKLKIGTDRQKAALQHPAGTSSDKLGEWLNQSRLLFWDSPIEAHNKINGTEAQRVVRLLEVIREMYQEGFKADTVGVITPYRAQIAEIYGQLDEELQAKVSIDTVERYQGSEREIIIISMAVNHPEQLKNLQAFNAEQSVDKKLNVALTRAREQVVLLGNEKVLKEGKFYEKLIEFMKKK